MNFKSPRPSRFLCGFGEELWDRIAEEGKVLLTPGFDMHFKEPGFFRVCYAWVPPGSLPLAVSRIKHILDQVEASMAE